MDEPLTNLEQLLDKMEEAAEDHEQVSLGVVLESIGTRSLGPLLLLAGVVTFSPLSGIPGMPTVMAVLVLTIAVQLLLGRDHLWLPKRLLKRSISTNKLTKSIHWMRRPARFVDHWTKPRLKVLVKGPGSYLIAIICTLIGLGIPAMELVPFSASAAGAALTAFGLSLVSCDGLLAAIAFVMTSVVLALVGLHLF